MSKKIQIDAVNAKEITEKLTSYWNYLAREKDTALNEPVARAYQDEMDQVNGLIGHLTLKVRGAK